MRPIGSTRLADSAGTQSPQGLNGLLDSLKSTERELNLMSKVFMDGTDPIIIEDLSGRVLHVNDEAERVYGWSRKELIGSGIDLLLSDNERHRADRTAPAVPELGIGAERGNRAAHQGGRDAAHPADPVTSDRRNGPADCDRQHRQGHHRP